MGNPEEQNLTEDNKTKSDALRLLAARPRSVEELRSRLKLKRHTDTQIDPVLDLLKKQGLLDDEKFARLFAVSKTLSKPVGRKQLEMDLKKKGISPRIIEGTISGLTDYDEKDAIRKIAQTRYSRMRGLSAEKRKARLFGFLKRRGFSNDAIFSVLSELVSGDNFTESGETDEG